MVIINLKTKSQMVNKNLAPKSQTSLQSHKAQINILPFPGLAQTGTEQLGQGATLLGWPKSIYYDAQQLGLGSQNDCLHIWSAITVTSGNSSLTLISVSRTFFFFFN